MLTSPRPALTRLSYWCCCCLPTSSRQGTGRICANRFVRYMEKARRPLTCNLQSAWDSACSPLNWRDNASVLSCVTSVLGPAVPALSAPRRGTAGRGAPGGRPLTGRLLPQAWPSPGAGSGQGVFKCEVIAIATPILTGHGENKAFISRKTSWYCYTSKRPQRVGHWLHTRCHQLAPRQTLLSPRKQEGSAPTSNVLQIHRRDLRRAY